jgi:hypothetical protein
MALILPSRATRLVQPHGPVEVNPQYLGKSPVLLASASARFANSVNGVPAVFGVGTSSPTSQFVPSPVGIGGTATVSSTTSSVLFPDFNFGGTKPITVIAFADAMPAANRSFLNQQTEIALRANATGNGVEFILNSFTGADRVSVVAGSRVSPGVFVAGTYGSSGKLRAYANGAFAEVTPGGTYAKRTDQFSAIYGLGLNTLLNTRLALVGLFESEFSIDELHELNANPWQLFRPASRSIIIDMGAGGGPVGGNASATPAPLTTTPATATATGAASTAAIPAPVSATPAQATATGGASAQATPEPLTKTAAQAAATGAAQAASTPAPVQLTPATATASGAAGGAVVAVATPAPITTAPATATATGGASAQATPALITITAPTASVGSGASASATLAALGLMPATGTATGGAAATALPAQIIITPATGSAKGGAQAYSTPAPISITPATGTASEYIKPIYSDNPSSQSVDYPLRVMAVRYPAGLNQVDYPLRVLQVNYPKQ